MNTEKMKKRRYVPQQLALALVLSTTALQVSAENMDLNSDISITKEDPCGVTVTSEGTSITGSISENRWGFEKMRLNDTSGAKITVQASGGEDCRIGTLKLAFHPGTQIHGSSALSSASSPIYFPFDYVLGPTQVTNAQGENEDESQVFDKISTVRGDHGGLSKPFFCRSIDRPEIIYRDNQYHLHNGQIAWESNGENVYLDTNYIPFWLSSIYEKVTFDGATSKKVKFSFIPITSSIGYDKATGKMSTRKMDIGENLSYTATLTVTTI
ncbi:hypothetical protein [Serratia ficaria]|uniref:hypothetical protein n=1 Tax=Serratia ficaria TaxID=61651 RepID=UPI0021783187|nr:hypothetical protein [Serratia ficaria]CAI1507752.1 Uncharacterised protein [Serratia ficaria]